MLSVNVYVLGDKGRTVATVNHSIANTEGVTSKLVSPDKLKGEVEEAESDLLHFVPSGAVLLPDFYKAMLSHLEHSQRDYVFCPCLRINADKTTSELKPDGEFSFGQLIVKSWVVRELGDLTDLKRMSRRIVSEYRGVEIPHCLYLEM